MIAALLALSLVIPARDAWTTGYVIDTPREWGVGGGLSIKWREGPACAPLPERAYVRQSMAVTDGVVCSTEGGTNAQYTVQRAGGWSRTLPTSVLHVVALSRERVAVFRENELLVVDARTGIDVAPPMALPGWPSWAALDGEVLLVRMHQELAAIDVSGTTPAVLWRDATDVARQDEGPLVRCGRRWVDVAAVRDFTGDFTKTKGHVVLRVLDVKQGLVGRKLVKTEVGFFDSVRFEPSCSDAGRIHVVARWIILD